MRRALGLSLLLAACGQNSDGTIGNADTVVQSSAPDVDENALILAELENGQPLMVRGDFRTINGALSREVLAPAMVRISTMLGVDASELAFVAAERDELGMGHAQYQQTSKGLPVVGGDMKVHVDASGRVFSLTGTSAVTKSLPSMPAVQREEAAIIAADNARDGLSLIASDSRLVYVITDDRIGTYLAWEVIVEGEDGYGPIRDRVYVDAIGGSIVARHPTIHFARQRAVYTASNKTSLPGTLKRSEGDAATADVALDASYDNAGLTYDAYMTLFGRDSYDGRGASLKSTVHYSTNYVNAFWNGQQMVYGDGNNRDSIELSRAIDVTAHELTHAVTEYSSGLNYSSGDTGSMNEAMSDIFGAVVESWSRGWEVNAATWLVGEDIWTPGVAGDALRYMDDPVKDNYSLDDYNDIKRSTEVHSGSGIGNLAFSLLVTGGRHPRNASNVTVAGIGMEKAAQIFYRAQAKYLSSTSNYPAFRAATVQAAQDLYGASEVTAVNDAWSAVNVPGAGGGGGGGDVVLVDGVAKDDLSGDRRSKVYYAIDVPSGASSLVVQTSGGEGDVDLYIRYEKKPGTWFFYDAKSTSAGNEESLHITQPKAGRYWVLLRGQETYSGVSIVANY